MSTQENTAGSTIPPESSKSNTSEPTQEQHRILAIIPTLTAKVDARTVTSVQRQIGQSAFAFIIGQKPVAAARNHAVEQFLKSEATHLWFVDDDTIPPPDALEKLLAMDTPIATAITPTIQGTRIIYNIYKQKDGKYEAYENGHPLPEAEEMTVAAVGSSCILIKREVFEKMGDGPWYFDMWGKDGSYMSEDLVFCQSAKEFGFIIKAHPKVICGHERSIVL